MNSEASIEMVEDGFPNGLVRYKGVMLLGDPGERAEDMDNFEVRDDDVWLCGFMRSGTRWAKEMIWRIANDLNLESTKELKHRFPCFDRLLSTDASTMDGLTFNEMLSNLNSLPSQRFLKTHLPFQLVPRQLRNGEKKAKIIYIARNPKDVCVSLYYFYKHFCNFKGNLEDLTDLFIADKLRYAPYWNSVLSFWSKRNEFNILFLKYEDMINDLPSVIRKTANFFDKVPTDEQVAALSLHLSFENFCKDPILTNKRVVDIVAKRFNHKEVNGYVRKGTKDQWQQEMSADTARRVDEWTEKNIRNTDYKI